MAAERAIAMVNAPIDEAAAVLSAHGETDLTGLDDERAALDLAISELRGVLELTDRDEAAAGLNDLMARHASAPRLERHDGWDWHLHVERDDRWAPWLVASAALDLALRLASRGALPWGVCDGHDCANVFIDQGRGGRRRYCSTRCATRERVRKHRSGVR